jgi:hypothetical protein
MGVAEPASFDTPSETIRTNHYQSESEGVFMGWAVAGGTAGGAKPPELLFPVICGAPVLFLPRERHHNVTKLRVVC